MSRTEAPTSLRYWQIATVVLLGVLIGVALHAYVFWEHAGHEVVEMRAQYPLIDPTRHLIAQEHFIVDIQPLREQLRELEDQAEKIDASIYFEFLNTGANVSINNELAVWPSSLLKVPMAMAVMKKIEKGEWQLDSEFVVAEQDRDSSYGTLWRRPIGTRISTEELLREMLGRSDNTAYRMFNRNIDVNELIEVLEDLGIEDLFNEQGLMTAKEYSRLFRALYTSSFLKREDSQYLLSVLSDAEFKGFIDAGIPDDVLFAHKFGINSEQHAALDSGIVFVPHRPYLITVAIKTSGDPEQEESVKEFMKRVGEITYTYVSSK